MTSPVCLERNDKDMMDFNMFQEVVKEKITDYLPPEFENAEVTVHEVVKVNRILHSLTVTKPDNPAAPNVYLEKMYDSYRANENLKKSLKEIAKEVVEATNHLSENLPVVDDSRFEDNVILCLVNSTQNEELLKNVPNRSFQDLSVIYRWVVGMNREGMQSMIVTNSFAASHGISERELFRRAVQNTRRICPPKVCSMQEIVAEMMIKDGSPEDLVEAMGVMDQTQPEKTVWVITNQMGLNGAASMLYEDNLHKLAQKVGTDLYVLPSSIHETIAVSVEMGEPGYLAQMVHDVNMNAVSLEERLSNNVYHYDKDLRKLELATDVPEKRLDDVVAEPPLFYEKDGPAR